MALKEEVRSLTPRAGYPFQAGAWGGDRRTPSLYDSHVSSRHLPLDFDQVSQVPPVLKVLVVSTPETIVVAQVVTVSHMTAMQIVGCNKK